MLARIITLKFNSMLNAFDDEPLREFIKDKEVLSIRDYFFIKDDAPYLAMIVYYSMPAQAPRQTSKDGRRDESWRDLVAEADVPLFNALRDWRNERSKKEGIPPYIIFTNRQLAAIVSAHPQSLSKLSEVEGCGKSKLEKYGEEIIKLMANTHKPEGSEP